MSSFPQPPVRIWPAVVILLLQVAAIGYSVTAEFDNFSRFMAMMLGPAVCLLLFLVYWFGFSRVPMRERLVLPLLSLVTAVIIAFLVHTTARAPMWMYGIPITLLLATLGLFFTRKSSPKGRFPLLASLLVVAWLPFLLVRLDGFVGSYLPEFAWRWTPTTEELLAKTRKPAEASATESEVSTTVIELSPEDWPGFRGADRNSRVKGVTINADWSKKPPKQVWEISVGPAWSSFAVVGEWLFTQEQFGEKEAVVCYEAATGKERWRHEDTARFSELVAGPGPRATPTFVNSRIYSLGAMANLNCLDASTGKVLWSHDLMKELGAKLPEWGFASSPLVMDDVAIVYADGKDDHGLVAYNAVTGEPAWHIACTGMNFSSPQPMVFGDKAYAVFAGGTGIMAIEPKTGKVVWRNTPSGWVTASMIQPQQIDGTSLVVGLGDGIGTARLKVTTSNDSWSITQQWTSKNLKPSFNDFVLHDDSLYGFDQNIFTSVDVTTGKRHWKKGRYGFGQALLFEDQGLVLVVDETGEIVLIACDPKEHREVARHPAIEGKTWNHPAFARGRLYVRNAQKAVCLDLSP